jgi:NADH-quinone oxidoreductase subunit L
MTLPLIILAALSLTGGFIEMPENMGPVHLFSRLFDQVLPAVRLSEPENNEYIFQILSAGVSLGGIWLAYRLFYRKSAFAARFTAGSLFNFFRSGWGFDRIYNFLFVRPVVWLSEIDKKDFTDLIYTSIARVTGYFHLLLSRTQNGKLRWYALALTIGIVLILTFIISQ